MLQVVWFLALYGYVCVAGGVVHGSISVRGAEYSAGARSYSARGAQRHPVLSVPGLQQTEPDQREYGVPAPTVELPAPADA